MDKEILMIEDDDRFRRSIKLLFGDTDYKFHEASSVGDGLRLLEEFPTIGVVILDLAFPGDHGAEFLKRIRNRSSNYRVIVLTAHDELFAAEVAASFEVFSYMSKSAGSIREPLRFQVAAAFNDLERAWLQKKTQFHLEIDRKVRNFGTDASIEDDQQLKDVLNLICGHAVELIKAYTCHIRLLDADKGEFVLWACRGRVENSENVLSKSIPYGGAYSGIAADTHAALNIADIQDDPLFKDIRESALSRGEMGEEFKQYFDEVRSGYVAPISTGVFGNDIDAVFNVTSDVPAFFTEARVELVDEFVTQTAIAITKYRLARKRNQVPADYQNISDMLGEVSNELKGEGELDKIYEIVFRRISAALKPEVISIFHYDRQEGRLVNVAEFRGNQGARQIAEEYLPGEGLVGHVYSACMPVRINIRRDAHGGLTGSEHLLEGLMQEHVENTPSGEMRHYLAVPIKIGNNTIGVLRVINKKSAYYDSEEDKTKNICLLRTGFSDDCQTTLEIAASHLAVTIQNAELIGKLNMKVQQLESIHKVGMEISSEVDVDAVLDLIVESAAKVMHAEICLLFLTNEKADKVVLTHIYGMPIIEEAFYSLGEGKLGYAAQTGKLILEERADESHLGKYDEQITRYLREKHGADSKGIESFMVVPIIGKGRILGAIKVVNKVKPPFQFDEDDLRLFQIFASQIGLERALYFQKRLHNVVENSPDPMIFLDKQGRLEVFNRACEHLWGYSREEALGRSIVGFYASEEQAREIGKKLWESEDHRIHNAAAEIKDRNGTVIPVTLSSAFLFDENGNRMGTIGVFKDLREIKRLQTQMVQAERLAAIGKLTHSIGHDIKGQIATALNYVDVLLLESEEASPGSTHTSKEEYVQVFTDMRSALMEATGKIRDILMAAQPESPKKTTVRLSDIFADTLSPMARQANYKNVEFVARVTDDTRLVFLDVAKITQALSNLFDNSLEAIDKKTSDNRSFRGRIEVSVSMSGKLMELTWEDNGCGIPAEKQPNIFDAFYTANKANGTGLGLYIVQRVVDDHGGSIYVDSVEGQGASFKIILHVGAD